MTPRRPCAADHERLRDISKQLLHDALRENTSPEDAQRKLRLRDEIESHLLAADALVELGATNESVARILSKLSDLEEHQPA